MHRLICFGDSLTAGYGAAPKEGWIPILSRQYPGLSLTNRGLCGACLPDILDDLSFFLSRPAEDLLLFIMGGTNDILSGVRLTVLKALIESSVKKSISVSANMLIGIPPLTVRSSILSGWQGDWQYEDTNRSLKEYGSFLRDTAASAGYPVIDFQKTFTNAPDSLYDDGVHPNASGYRIFAQAAAQVLDPFLEKEKTAVRPSLHQDSSSVPHKAENTVRGHS